MKQECEPVAPCAYVVDLSYTCDHVIALSRVLIGPTSWVIQAASPSWAPLEIPYRTSLLHAKSTKHELHRAPCAMKRHRVLLTVASKLLLTTSDSALAVSSTISRAMCVRIVDVACWPFYAPESYRGTYDCTRHGGGSADNQPGWNRGCFEGGRYRGIDRGKVMRRSHTAPRIYPGLGKSKQLLPHIYFQCWRYCVCLDWRNTMWTSESWGILRATWPIRLSKITTLQRSTSCTIA